MTRDTDKKQATAHHARHVMLDMAILQAEAFFVSTLACFRVCHAVGTRIPCIRSVRILTPPNIQSIRQSVSASLRGITPFLIKTPAT